MLGFCSSQWLWYPVFVSMTCFQSSFCDSIWWWKRKACQYRVLDPWAVHIPFLVTSSLARIKRVLLTPQSQICMLWSLPLEFFYSRKSEEPPRIRSLPIGWFFLSSMQQMLLQERPPRKTHESAPTGGRGSPRFTRLFDGCHCWLATAASTTFSYSSQETWWEARVRPLHQDVR